MAVHALHGMDGLGAQMPEFWILTAVSARFALPPE